MKKRFANCYLFILILLSFIRADRVSSFDIFIELSGGYDDNVSQKQTASGSGFTLHRLKMTQPLFPNCPSIDGNLFFNGNYQNYFEISDNYEIVGGGSLTFPLAKGEWLPHIFSEATVYRDNFTPEDDRDEVMAGGAFEWLATGRLTLGFRQLWQWHNYKNLPVLYPDHHTSSGMGHGNGYGPGSSKWKRHQSLSRNDQISTTGLDGTFFFSPTLQAYLSAEYNILNSDIETESYNQSRMYLFLLWRAHEMWEITARGSWKASDYKEPIPERTDTTYFISLGISYFIRNFEIFFQAEQTDNDSSLDIESYRQMVTQCGVVMSF